MAKGVFGERYVLRKAGLCEMCVCAKGMSCAKGVWRKVLSARQKFSILGCECHEPNQASDMILAINLSIFNDQ